MTRQRIDRLPDPQQVQDGIVGVNLSETPEDYSERVVTSRPSGIPSSRRKTDDD